MTSNRAGRIDELMAHSFLTTRSYRVRFSGVASSFRRTFDKTSHATLVRTSDRRSRSTPRGNRVGFVLNRTIAYSLTCGNSIALFRSGGLVGHLVNRCKQEREPGVDEIHLGHAEQDLAMENDAVVENVVNDVDERGV